MTQPILQDSANALASEDECYWKQQIERFKESDLTRKAFCKLSDLKYHRFQYWYHKFEQIENPRPPTGLIPIKLKSDKEPCISPTLCSLRLPTGAILYLHDRVLVETLIKGEL